MTRSLPARRTGALSLAITLGFMCSLAQAETLQTSSRTQGISTGGNQTRGISTGGDRTRGISTGGDRTRGISTGGNQTRGISTGGDRTRGISTGGDRTRGISTGGDRTRGISTGGDRTRGISTGGDRTRGISTGGDRTRGISTGGDRTRGISTGGDRTRGISTGGDRTRGISTGGSKYSGDNYLRAIDACGVSGVVAHGAIESLDLALGTVGVLGQTIAIGDASAEGLAVGDVVTVYGRVLGNGFAAAEEFVVSGEQYVPGGTQVLVSGFVTDANGSVAQIQIGGLTVDHSAVGAIEDGGSIVTFAGTQPASGGVMLATSTGCAASQ